MPGRRSRRVGLFELLVVAVEALPGDVEELFGVGVEVGGEGAAAVDAEGEAGVPGADGVPGPAATATR